MKTTTQGCQLTVPWLQANQNIYLLCPGTVPLYNVWTPAQRMDVFPPSGDMSLFAVIMFEEFLKSKPDLFYIKDHWMVSLDALLNNWHSLSCFVLTVQPYQTVVQASVIMAHFC